MPPPSASHIYRFIVSAKNEDPRSASLLADAHLLGFQSLKGLECKDLFFIEGDLNPTNLQRLADELLSDPITQQVEWTELEGAGGKPSVEPVHTNFIEVALRPGVTDPVADQIVRAAREMGMGGTDHRGGTDLVEEDHRLGVLNASTGFRYCLPGELSEQDLHGLAQRLLANPTIQRYALGDPVNFTGIEPSFPHPVEASGKVEILPVRHLDATGLLALSHSRRAALDLAEMEAIQAYYRQVDREPTDVEFETIAQTWSEHCVHKTFKALITLDENGQVIDNLLKTYLKSATDQIAAPWVRSAFVDNAGIIDFDDEFEVSFKVETHNHPSAIEPFGGANTGVGGVIRDVLGVSAKPIANTDVLCFGPQETDPASLPEGVLHPRRVRSGVVAGVQDYGNKMGIPTVNGAILYDPGYTANPLVFCGCVGLAPKGSHPRTPLVGDRVIVIGGRTGRDGLRGATFSSMTMDAQTGEVSGASVQIGDPITEKGVSEVVLRARDLQLYHAITDCGAGGLSSAVGEMSSQIGAQVDLTHVRLKYPGLAPWEIWLSEAQERMVLAVPTEKLPELVRLCELFDVEWSDIGSFSGDGRLVVCYRGQAVLNLENEFLHEGIPQRHLTATIPTPPLLSGDGPGVRSDRLGVRFLLRLLSHPNIASKADVVHLYDHEVQGGTVIKPLTGLQTDGPSDACVIRPIGTHGRRAIALANGLNPEYGKLDAYRMAWSVIDEAVRNAVAVGADASRIALLDNFCWGDPKRPETLGGLVEAARGCHEAALHYRTPFISGKDSLNNEYLGSDGQRHAIPPTLLISSIGILEDWSQAMTMDLKTPGNWLYLVGDFRPTWGGSYFSQLFGVPDDAPELTLCVPAPSSNAPAVYAALHQAICQGLVRACHDLSEGGLSVAAAEMCLAGRLGLHIDLDRLTPKPQDPLLTLFGETNGCLLVEVRATDADAFESLLAGLPTQRIGQVSAELFLKVLSEGFEPLILPVNSLVTAFSTPHATEAK